MTIWLPEDDGIEALYKAAKKVLQAFPSDIPEGQDTQCFNVPRYILDELQAAVEYYEE